MQVKNRILFFTHIIFLVFLNSSFSGTWINDGADRNENNYLSISIAVFDIIQNKNRAIEGRVEYRLYKVPIAVKPLSGLMVNSDGAIYIFAGILYDIPITSFLYITPSFSPGLYFKNNSKDLGFILEFRSQIEIALKLENKMRFGLSFNHISNGPLGKINPGVESLAVFIQFPL